MYIPLSLFPCQYLVGATGMNGKWFGINVMHMPFRCSGIFLLLEGVTVFHPQGVFYIFLAIDFRSLLFKVVEGADVIQPTCVVFMVMSQKNCVYVCYTGTKHLLPEIRTGIYKYAKPFVVHENAGAKPLVARILAAADIAAATYHRHSLRCACTQECQSGLLHVSGYSEVSSFPHRMTGTILPIDSGSYGLETLM